jgi:NodT family efflux transporter outer membrane factor (OMF) lipoprotein
VSFNGEISADNSSQVGIEEFFEDPILTSLMDEGLNGNLQLKVLAEDIQIANNEVLRRRGMYLPFVTLGGGASLTKYSANSVPGIDNLTDARLGGGGFPSPLPDFMAAANMSWQIDIWRQLRNARDAATLRWLGTCEGRNYVVTRLISEIAENYYSLLALDRRIENLDTIIEIQEQSLEFSKARKAAARGTELAVQRFQAEVRKNQSEKLIIKQDIIEVENRINFLVGRFPEPVQRSTNFYDLNLHSLSLGAPAELLQNRPDIREAERILEASGLDIKVARANFYPRVNLTAGVGYDAFNTKYLIMTPESLIWNVAGDVVAPLINKTAIKAEYMNANAKQLQALYDYQRVVLNAFTEVINRVSKVQNYSKSIEIKKQQLKSLEASVAAATNLFQNARVEYMDVLFSQRDLVDARMVLIETKKQQLAAIANTYQALGGGLVRFNSEPLPPISDQPNASPIQMLPSPEPVEAPQ